MLISSDMHSPLSATQPEADGFVQSALDALSAHIAILDKTGRIIGVNAAWSQFAKDNGFNASNFGVGLNYLKVCDASARRNSSDAPQVANGIRSIIAGQINEFKMEYPCHSPTQKRWFVVRISRFDWYNEMRLIVAHQNVSELKEVQIELEESRNRLELILENINNAILTLNSAGTIQTANTATARIFGYDAAQLPGMHLSQLMTEPFTGRGTFKRLNSEYGHELTGIRCDGSHFPIYIALSELLLDGSNLYICIIQDITLRKRIETDMIERERLTVALEKERELRELKNRFLSMMSHELRTPLASIRLSHDMLKKYGDVSTPEEQDQALDNINMQVGYLADMVTDVITFSRGEAEGITATLENTDLITYCRDIFEEFQFTYHRTHRLEFECEERIIRAEIDKKLLRRALTNLLTNAIKYSPDNSQVTMILSCLDNTIMIEICDTGIGIPPEDQMRLFEPFHRAANATNFPGTGLGLSITRQAIELQGGSISFNSSAAGTTFIVRLPLHR